MGQVCKSHIMLHLQNGWKWDNVSHFQATISIKSSTMEHLQICHSDNFVNVQHLHICKPKGKKYGMWPSDAIAGFLARPGGL